MFTPDADKISAAEKILMDNGIEKDEAATVLQAIGYALLDTELYPKDSKPEQKSYWEADIRVTLAHRVEGIDCIDEEAAKSMANSIITETGFGDLQDIDWTITNVDMDMKQKECSVEAEIVGKVTVVVEADNEAAAKLVAVGKVGEMHFGNTEVMDVTPVLVTPID